MAIYEVKNGEGIIPEGTTTIERGAFKDCEDLKSLIIPEGVTSIGASAFSNCPALENVKITELTMTDKALEEIVIGHKYTPYPLVRYTERPDTFSAHLYQGMFGIIVDNSPSAILGPVSVFDHMQHAEEFRQTPIAGTYLRILRFLGIIFSFIFLNVPSVNTLELTELTVFNNS